MTKEERIRGYLGLAARAGKIESGEFSTEKAVRSGRAHVVYVANDASENTRKKFQNMCSHYRVPLFTLTDRESMGHMIGKQFRASLAVTDERLAAVLVETENRFTSF